VPLPDVVDDCVFPSACVVSVICSLILAIE
jgi:hypothetical protein